jgi:8-oxo-dGTP pyrophosphatase MutT (NUDIX family)
MSDYEAAFPRKKPPQGPLRTPGDPLVRPKTAATIILVRRDSDKPRVLMGRRNRGHNFMPSAWVFPGGRVDRADSRAPFATDLSPDAQAVFDAHVKPGRARAIALAAVREVWEEVGLLLAKPAPVRPVAGPWRDFVARGALPDQEGLQVIARAITPPRVAKRFDTWFLMSEAERLLSLERQPDCGEFDDIAWVGFDEADDLSLPHVTRLVLREAQMRLSDPDRPRPFLRQGGSGAKGVL